MPAAARAELPSGASASALICAAGRLPMLSQVWPPSAVKNSSELAPLLATAAAIIWPLLELAVSRCTCAAGSVIACGDET